MEKPTEIKLTKSTFKSAKFLKSVLKTSENLFKSSFVTAADEFLGNSFSGIEKKALDLVIYALGRSIIEIIKADGKNQDLINSIPNYTTNMQLLTADFQTTVNEFEMTIDGTFLSSPQDWKYLNEFQSMFKSFLIHDLEIIELYALQLSNQLKKQFAYELPKLWSEKPDYFEEIRKYFSNPFFENIEKIEKVNSYELKVSSYFNELIMTKKAKLSDVYVEPAFLVYKDCIDIGGWNKLSEQSGFCRVKRGENIHDFYMDLFKSDLKRENYQNIHIILGQPGQGKTSFCRKLLNDLSTSNEYSGRIFHIKLRELINVDQLLNEPFREIRKKIATDILLEDLPYPLSDFQDSCIVLDGLDEIYMHDSVNEKRIKDFLVKLKMETCGIEKLNLIITSRYNYIDLSVLDYSSFLILNLRGFDLEKQILWLNGYRRFHPKGILNQNDLEKVDSSLNREYKSLKELFEQPILLQLIYESEVSIQTGLDFRKTDIYEHLLEKIWSRCWASEGQLENYRDFGKEHFIAFLEEIALNMFLAKRLFVRDTELTLNSDFMDLLKSSGSISMQDILSKAHELINGFYFKKTKSVSKSLEPNNYVIEFLHKSFYEFFVAKRIAKFISENLDSKIINNESEAEDVLLKIASVFSCQLISREIMGFVHEILKSDFESKIQKNRDSNLNFCLKSLLKKECFLLEVNVLEKLDVSFLDASINMLSNYLELFSRFENVVIPFECRIQFFRVFRLASLEGVNVGYGFKDCDFSGLDFSGLKLEGYYFENCDFSNSNFERTFLEGIQFHYNCDFTNSFFQYSQVYDCEFFKCNFLNSSWENMTFLDKGAGIGVIIDDCNFEKAYWGDLKLHAFFISNCSFEETKWRRCDFGGVRFEKNTFKIKTWQSSPLINQLETSERIFQNEGLAMSLINRLRKRKPSLFSED